MTDGVTSGPDLARARSVGEVCDSMRLSRAQVVIGSILFVTFVIEAWEQVGLIYVSAGFSEEFGLGDAQVGIALSAVAFGMIPGALLWGPLIDRVGRRPVVVWSFLLYSACGLLSGLAPTYGTFVGLRVLAGVAFAGVYTATFPYFMEMLPTRNRGRGAVALSIGFPLGTLLCIAVSQALGPAHWRSVAVVSALAGLWALVVRRWVPESPYWLARRGRHEEAARVLHRLGAPPVATPFRIDDGAADSLPGLRDGLLGDAIRRTFLLLLVVSFTFSWGYWGLQTWLPVLLQDRGMTLSASLWFVALSQVISIPGYLLAAWLTGRLGRRPVFLGFTGAAAVGAVVFATAGTDVQLYAGNIVLAFFSLGAWGVWNTWSAEVLPTGLRGVGYAWVTSAILLASTLAVPVIGAMMDGGLSQTVIIGSIAAVLAIALVAVLPLPETEGRALV